MMRDRRGVGVAEYALLLFLVILIAAVAYRYMGGNVNRAGTRTNEQFQSGGSGGSGGGAGGGAGGNKTAGGADSAGGANGQNTAAGGTAGAGGAGGAPAAGGGGGGGAGGAGGAANNQASGGGAVGNNLDDAEEAGKTPLWKIIGIVFVVLFGIGGYLAFRKQSKSG